MSPIHQPVGRGMRLVSDGPWNPPRSSDLTHISHNFAATTLESPEHPPNTVLHVYHRISTHDGHKSLFKPYLHIDVPHEVKWLRIIDWQGVGLLTYSGETGSLHGSLSVWSLNPPLQLPPAPLCYIDGEKVMRAAPLDAFVYQGEPVIAFVVQDEIPRIEFRDARFPSIQIGKQVISREVFDVLIQATDSTTRPLIGVRDGYLFACVVHDDECIAMGLQLAVSEVETQPIALVHLPPGQVSLHKHGLHVFHCQSCTSITASGVHSCNSTHHEPHFHIAQMPVLHQHEVVFPSLGVSVCSSFEPGPAFILGQMGIVANLAPSLAVTASSVLLLPATTGFSGFIALASSSYLYLCLIIPHDDEPRIGPLDPRHVESLPFSPYETNCPLELETDLLCSVYREKHALGFPIISVAIGVECCEATAVDSSLWIAALGHRDNETALTIIAPGGERRTAIFPGQYSGVYFSFDYGVVLLIPPRLFASSQADTRLTPPLLAVRIETLDIVTRVVSIAPARIMLRSAASEVAACLPEGGQFSCVLSLVDTFLQLTARPSDPSKAFSALATPDATLDWVSEQGTLPSDFLCHSLQPFTETDDTADFVSDAFGDSADHEHPLRRHTASFLSVSDVLSADTIPCESDSDSHESAVDFSELQLLSNAENARSLGDDGTAAYQILCGCTPTGAAPSSSECQELSMAPETYFEYLRAQPLSPAITFGHDDGRLAPFNLGAELDALMDDLDNGRSTGERVTRLLTVLGPTQQPEGRLLTMLLTPQYDVSVVVTDDLLRALRGYFTVILTLIDNWESCAASDLCPAAQFMRSVLFRDLDPALASILTSFPDKCVSTAPKPGPEPLSTESAAATLTVLLAASHTQNRQLQRINNWLAALISASLPDSVLVSVALSAVALTSDSSLAAALLGHKTVFPSGIALPDPALGPPGGFKTASEALVRALCTAIAREAEPWIITRAIHALVSVLGDPPWSQAEITPLVKAIPHGLAAISEVASTGPSVPSLLEQSSAAAEALLRLARTTLRTDPGLVLETASKWCGRIPLLSRLTGVRYLQYLLSDPALGDQVPALMPRILQSLWRFVQDAIHTNKDDEMIINPASCWQQDGLLTPIFTLIARIAHISPLIDAISPVIPKDAAGITWDEPHEPIPELRERNPLPVLLFPSFLNPGAFAIVDTAELLLSDATKDIFNTINETQPFKKQGCPPITAMSFSPDGSHIAVYSSSIHRVHIFRNSVVRSSLALDPPLNTKYFDVEDDPPGSDTYFLWTQNCPRLFRPS